MSSITVPRPARSDVPWTPDFEYRCTGGHHLGADHRIDVCPVIVHAEECGCGRRLTDVRCGPCPGDLERVGKGSRS